MIVLLSCWVTTSYDGIGSAFSASTSESSPDCASFLSPVLENKPNFFFFFFSRSNVLLWKTNKVSINEREERQSLIYLLDCYFLDWNSLVFVSHVLFSPNETSMEWFLFLHYLFHPSHVSLATMNHLQHWSHRVYHLFEKPGQECPVNFDHARVHNRIVLERKIDVLSLFSNCLCCQ